MSTSSLFIFQLIIYICNVTIFFNLQDFIAHCIWSDIQTYEKIIFRNWIITTGQPYWYCY